MARVIMLLLGVVVTGGSIWAMVACWGLVWPVLLTLLICAALLFGLALLIFGFGEIVGARAAERGDRKVVNE